MIRAVVTLSCIASVSSFSASSGITFRAASSLRSSSVSTLFLHEFRSRSTFPRSWGPPLRHAVHHVLRQRGGGATASYASAAAEGSSIIDDDSLYSTAKKVKWAQDGQEYDVGGWSAHVLKENEGEEDWVKQLELAGALAFNKDANPPLPQAAPGHKPRVLVLYGSLRPESFSRKLALECARILDLLGCDIRVYNPRGLPLRDPALEEHPKVQELRALSDWSEGHVWISPEMHGEVTGAFKTQIDWLPLNTGSVRPTQGRSVMIAQVNGGSQSFNVVNSLRKLARWMRMNCVTNQSSVPKAWKEFDEGGRMKASEFRDRVVDVCEEFYKYTLILRPYSEFLVDRYSERKEKEEKGRLLTQAEKEKAKDEAAKAQTEKDALMAQVNDKMNK